MIPFFFGTSQRRLFGLYTPGAGKRAVVLCHPWGQEYLRAHRSMKQLGNLLGRAGFHVLRFDYFGTGDSAGEMSDADVKGWKDDIQTAIDELKDTTEAQKVSLAGLRLGATLAAIVAAGRPKEVDALVLWDPVVSGADYVAALEHAAHFPNAGSMDSLAINDAPPVHILGFPLSRSMALEMRGLDLPNLVPKLPARTLILTSEPTEANPRLSEALAARNPPGPCFERIVSPPAWTEDEDTGVGAIPVKVLQRIVEWIS